MTLIALPAGFCPNSFTMRQQSVQRVFASSFGGSEQVVDLQNDRWLVSLSLPNRLHADAARVEAFIAALRGMANTVALYHWVRKQPRGSMRGAPTAQAQGAGSGTLPINTVPGATLLAGDMIGVGGLLLQIAEDATANGAGVLAAPLVNRLRIPVAAGSSVFWDRPVAPFRLSSTSAVQYIPGYSPEVSFDFVEAIS